MMMTDPQTNSHQDHVQGDRHGQFKAAAGDPISSNENPDGSGIPTAKSKSIVPDLMQVYESLTQSSTPQVSQDDAVSGKTNVHGEQNSSYPIPPPIHTGQFGAHNQHPSFGGPTPVYYSAGQQPYYSDHNFGQQPFMEIAGSDSQHGYMMPDHDMSLPQSTRSMDQTHVDENDTESANESLGRPKRTRRGSLDTTSSGSNRGRKKSKCADGRWSKRFTWPEELHRDFVSAIFDVGLKHSSPSTILEHMPKHEQITTERIKSHLQKYRMHRVKSKKEFISSYEASLRNFQKSGMEGVQSISGSETAAQLTYAESTGTDFSNQGQGQSSKNAPAQEENKAPQSETLMLPQLTEAEKSTAMGAAMGHLMGLFLSLKQQLMNQRAEEARKNAVAHVEAPSAVASIPSTGPGIASQNSADPSQAVRTNIEQNSMMKREMQSQMALQNKMRGLKQRELNKYKNMPGHASQEKSGPEHQTEMPPEEHDHRFEMGDGSHIQGAGELGGSDDDNDRHNRPRALSLGIHDELWNTDVVDEQLFEFLINN